MTDTDPQSAREDLRHRIAEWLFQHEDDEHNAMPHVDAPDNVQNHYDAKVYGWADELVAISTAQQDQP